MRAETAADWEQTRARRGRERRAQLLAERERLTAQLLALPDDQSEGALAQRSALLQRTAELDLEIAERSARVQNATLGVLSRQADAAMAVTEGTPSAALTVRTGKAFRVNPLVPSKADPLSQGRLPYSIQASEVPPVPGSSVPPEEAPGTPEFDAAQKRAAKTRLRRERLQMAIPGGVLEQGEQKAETARINLGTLMQGAVDAGVLSEEQGLLMMAAGGLNAGSMTRGEIFPLLHDLLAQAVQANVLGVGRARTIARLIQEAPALPEQASVPVPDPAPSPSLAELKRLALDVVPLSGAPLSPAGVEARATVLQMLAREVPTLIDRLQHLEDVVYEALLVEPCHAGHALHLQTPMLCDEQAADLARTLMSLLGLSSRALPRDVHREPDGTKRPCCAGDGRIGTWLVHGQYLAALRTEGPTIRG